MTLSVAEEMNGSSEKEGSIVGHADAVAVESQDGESAVPAVAVVASINDSLAISDEFPLAATEVIIPEPLDEPPGTQDAEYHHRPAFISATVLKNEPKTADIGISFEKVDEGLRISSIVSDGLFGTTPICEGDYVLSVNNNGCEDRTVGHVSRLIRRSKQAVTLVVRRKDGDPYIVSTMVTKPTPESRVGIGVQRVEGSLCVSSIDPSGLFAGGILNVGDKVFSIGGIPCPCVDSTSAIELVRKEKNTVTIVTWTEEEAGVVVATRTVSLGRSFLDLLWLWRKNIMIISITFAIIGIIAVVVSQTGTKTPCEDLGQRPLPVARECP